MQFYACIVCKYFKKCLQLHLFSNRPTIFALLTPKTCIELCFLPFRRIFNFRENVDYMLFVTSNDSWSFTKTDSVSRNCQLVYMNKEGDSNIRKLNLISICSPTFSNRFSFSVLALYVAVSVLLFFTLLGVLYSLLKK